jgi:flavin reductase (DIM6/NTAB) family NADH-FMN oxidoreductase RutF
MKLKSFPVPEVYRLIEPGPVVMVTTSQGGQDNVMTMAWHTMMEFTPTLIGCVISERDYTFKRILATKECVIAVPTAELAAKVVKVGNVSGKNLDKFQKFGLTKLPASEVSAPLLADCYANLECQVVDTTWVKKYNFFVLEVVRAWVNPAQKNPKFLHHSSTGQFTVDGRKIKVPWKMEK